MSVIHMETEQVRSVAKNLEQSAQQVMDFSTQLVNQVGNIPWEGQSREEFIIEIESVMRMLREKGEFATLLASRVERHVALWESCDSSFGGAGGGVPVNPGDGGIATTAAIPEEGQFPPGVGPFPGLKPEPGGTTMALGEEGQGPGVGPFPGTGPGGTTMAMGEEGQAIPGVDPPIGVQPEPPYLTTQAYPEEGQDPGLGPIFNKPQPTTMAMGEEGQTIPGIDPPIGVEPEPIYRSMAIGEDGNPPLDFIPVTKIKPDPGTPTTMAMGEEGQVPPGIDPPIGVEPEPPTRSTMAMGEEGQDPGLGPIFNKPQPTTMAMGEEGQAPPGIDPFPGIKPEPGNPTTMALGEEGQAPGFRPFPPKGNEPPEIFTMVVGEEGFSPIDPPDLQKK